MSNAMDIVMENTSKVLSGKVVKVEIGDNKIEYSIPEEYTFFMRTIKNIVEDLGESDSAIPLVNIGESTWGIIYRYCEAYYKNHDITDAKQIKEYYEVKEDTKFSSHPEWARNLINGLNKEDLFALINAANYLDMPGLLDVACGKVAVMITGKTPEEIRELFGIENDFTPEEEQEIRKRNDWCDAAF
uniref:F-box leucine-rich repeat protein n=1 Tax=Clandestinovirus TaxID=2831644 RepID=A0A8F8PK85_9VIRU|nr:F-box leucine-rich repeat protein [Clandestinovirus]